MKKQSDEQRNVKGTYVKWSVPRRPKSCVRTTTLQGTIQLANK